MMSQSTCCACGVNTWLYTFGLLAYFAGLNWTFFDLTLALALVRDIIMDDIKIVMKMVLVNVFYFILILAGDSLSLADWHDTFLLIMIANWLNRWQNLLKLDFHIIISIFVTA